MTTVEQVERACEEQFTLAQSPMLVRNYRYTPESDDYFFGGFIPHGTDVLGPVIWAADNNRASVLDLGAGKGTYLAKAIQAYGPDAIRPIGLTALAHPGQVDDRIDWVYGDIQRPNTWQPDDILLPESIDVAVSNLLFRNLVHPVRALANAIHLLKEGGEMFVDGIEIKLDPKTAQDAIGLIKQALDVNTGSYGYGLHYDDQNLYQHVATIKELHFVKNTDEKIFDGLVPLVGNPRNPDAVMYRVPGD